MPTASFAAPAGAGAADREFEVPELGTYRAFHIVGVGGGNMNTIASVLVAMGHRVSGSDLRASAVLERLERQGVRTYTGHSPGNLGDADAVAFSSAIRPDNVELAEGAPPWHPNILPGRHPGRHLPHPAGAGRQRHARQDHDHGDAGADPGASGPGTGLHGGGRGAGSRGAASWGKGPWLVVEADESDGTFLRLGAEGVVVTNVEADHLDHYGTEEALASAFRTFVEQATGPRVVCLDDPGAARSGGLAARGDHVRDVRRGGFPHRQGRTVGRLGALRRLDAVPRSGASSSPSRACTTCVTPSPLWPPRPRSASRPDVAREALARTAAWGAVSKRGAAQRCHLHRRLRAQPGQVPRRRWPPPASVAPNAWYAVFQPHRYSRTAALWRELGDA